ncbi:E2 (early) protein%2C N terminal [Chlamydia trachomatis]|nr:E2 (early) protein%2C N terminal [Chlamydia trachomatis]
METLCQRLNVCQEKILDCYELDSNKLSDQINYWKLVRYESAMFYKAREIDLKTVNHQVVPACGVSKEKACQAIEMHMALESLNNSEYNTEPWTMRDTCYELWCVAPKHCFKKQGVTVTVIFDGNKDNTMDYINWKCIYYSTDSGWVKTCGKVDYTGIYYKHVCNKEYYVEFEKEAKKYGASKWEVHVYGEVITCPEYVSSTCSDPLPTATPVEQLSNTHSTNCIATSVATTEAQTQHKRKRQRHSEPDSSTVTTPLSVDCANHQIYCGSGGPHIGGHQSATQTAYIVHLKGDTNSLKCLRYRFTKHKGLFKEVSSTWHWTSDTKKGIVTITFESRQQRETFIKTVKIPQSVSVSLGIMTV